jgi:hypothetical protein
MGGLPILRNEQHRDGEYGKKFVGKEISASGRKDQEV